MRLSANMAPVETMSITSLVEGIFTTLFQSLGFSTFSLHLVCSFSQFAWRLVITKLEVLSSGRGKKSFSWRARWLPVLKTLFIHWKKRSDTKLAFFVPASLVIFLYPFLSMTLDLKSDKIKHVASTDMIKIMEYNVNHS